MHAWHRLIAWLLLSELFEGVSSASPDWTYSHPSRAAFNSILSHTLLWLVRESHFHRCAVPLASFDWRFLRNKTWWTYLHVWLPICMSPQGQCLFSPTASFHTGLWATVFLGFMTCTHLGGLTPMCYVTTNVISHSVVWIYRTLSLFFSFSTEAMQCLMSYVSEINPSKMASSFWPDCIHVVPLFLNILHVFQNCLPACLIPETFWKRGMCGISWPDFGVCNHLVSLDDLTEVPSSLICLISMRPISGLSTLRVCLLFCHYPAGSNILYVSWILWT